ncbi:membrane protein [Neiella marina]|uniref:Membrane protein n=1 Tax=Neiella marina TaxID=508461 RepID=A0A8J2U491_9GAMM|nr:isoprenylcysteine carboxylmethyltransferase family protein [Neiella marina]GGA74019.1 membrane protein [Neiella marina]
MPKPKLGWLELKLPPVLQVAIAAGLIVLSPASTLSFPHWPLWSTLAITGAILGFTIAVSGVWQFRHHQTTVNPLLPEQASQLVTSGIYRYSRNPMYLGMLIALLGWSAWWLQPLGVIISGLFVLYMTRFQIVPEERALRAQFGSQFSSYTQQTRRWL